MPANMRAPEYGPFRSDQVREGDRYELSKGHPVYCAPSGGRHASTNTAGVAALTTDPAVTSAGIDAGFSPEPGVMRAPDIAIGNVPNQPGWIRGAPPLAVEYADNGQDEADLKAKISELLEAGTKHIWVVRLSGPRRVEVYEPGRGMRVVNSGEELEVPGVLQNPVPVEALFDREAAHEVALRNLLQRKGYKDLRDVEEQAAAQGEARGEARALLSVLDARGLEVSEQARARIQSCEDVAVLEKWLRRAVTVSSASEIFDDAK